MHRKNIKQAISIYKKPEKSNEVTLKQQLKYEQEHYIAHQDPDIVPVGKDVDEFTFSEFATYSLLLCAAFAALSGNTTQGDKVSESKECKASNSYRNITSGLNRHLNGTSVACLPNRIEKSTRVAPPYKGYPVKDITGLTTSCRSKPSGYTPGKVCKIHNKTYFLKKEGFEGDDPLFSKYNFLFAKNNIGITVPKAKIFYEYNYDYYLATKEVRDFMPARVLKLHDASIRTDLGIEDDEEIHKPKLVEKIGKQGVAKLAVAETFFADFNPGNWGYDKNGLVLVDLDKGPKLWYQYFTSARCDETSNLFRRVLLSIDDVIEMQKIYRTMLTKPVPKLHASVDMHEDMYKALLDVYIESCQHIIDTYKNKRSPSFPYEINHELKKVIATLGNEHYARMSQSQKSKINTRSR